MNRGVGGYGTDIVAQGMHRKTAYTGAGAFDGFELSAFSLEVSTNIYKTASTCPKLSTEFHYLEQP